METLAEILGALFEWGAMGGPRWMRIGCTTLMLLFVVALLTISLWWPR